MKPDSKADKRRREIIEAVDIRLDDMEESAILLGVKEQAHEFADAIVGIATYPRVAVVYRASKVVEAFMRMHDWDYEEAMEWYSYNTERAIPHLPNEDNPPILIEDVM